MGMGMAYAMGGLGGGAQGGNQILSFLPLVLIFIIFYFLLIRPQQKRAKEHRTLLENLKEGDYVLTTGGIYGKITGIKDNKLTLEISDKVRVKVSRGHIASVERQEVTKKE